MEERKKGKNINIDKLKEGETYKGEREKKT